MVIAAEVSNQNLESPELAGLANSENVDPSILITETNDGSSKIDIAEDVPEPVKNAFEKLKGTISKAKDWEYVGDEKWPWFMKFGKDIYYNSQWKSDNTRGKINEEGTFYAIFNKPYKFQEKDAITIGVRPVIKLKTDEEWKLLATDGIELRKDDKWYYAIEGAGFGWAVRYKINQDGKLIEKERIGNLEVTSEMVKNQLNDISAKDLFETWDGELFNIMRENRTKKDNYWNDILSDEVIRIFKGKLNEQYPKYYDWTTSLEPKTDNQWRNVFSYIGTDGNWNVGRIELRFWLQK